MEKFDKLLNQKTKGVLSVISSFLLHLVKNKFIINKIIIKI